MIVTFVPRDIIDGVINPFLADISPTVARIADAYSVLVA